MFNKKRTIKKFELFKKLTLEVCRMFSNREDYRKFWKSFYDGKKVHTEAIDKVIKNIEENSLVQIRPKKNKKCKLK